MDKVSKYIQDLNIKTVFYGFDQEETYNAIKELTNLFYDELLLLQQQKEELKVKEEETAVKEKIEVEEDKNEVKEEILDPQERMVYIHALNDIHKKYERLLLDYQSKENLLKKKNQEYNLLLNKYYKKEEELNIILSGNDEYLKYKTKELVLEREELSRENKRLKQELSQEKKNKNNAHLEQLQKVLEELNCD